MQLPRNAKCRVNQPLRDTVRIEVSSRHPTSYSLGETSPFTPSEHIGQVKEVRNGKFPFRAYPDRWLSCRRTLVGSCQVVVAMLRARVAREDGENRCSIGRIFRRLHVDILLLRLRERRARRECENSWFVEGVGF